MKRKKNKPFNYDDLKPIKGFHAVKFFRKIKRQISKELWNMTDKEYMEYMNSPDELDIKRK